MFKTKIQDLFNILTYSLHCGKQYLVVGEDGEVYMDQDTSYWTNDDEPVFVTDRDYYRITGPDSETYMCPTPSRRAREVSNEILSFLFNPSQQTALSLCALLNACEVENKTRTGWRLPTWEEVDAIINAFFIGDPDKVLFDDANE